MKIKFLTFIAACLFAAIAATPVFADGTINLADGSGDGDGWTFADNEILIQANGTYILTGTTTANRLTVKGSLKEVGITLQNASITSARAFYITSGSTVNLRLEGSNILKSTTAGNAGLCVPSGATLNLDGPGELTSTGCSDGNNCGAGIGAISGLSAGTMNFKGGIVNAIGTGKATSIGSGYHGGGGSINVSGGVITATSGYGIGNYNGTTGTGKLKITDNGIVFTNILHGNGVTLTATNGLYFLADAAGVFYGTDITPTNDFTLPKGKTLTIPEGKTLTIAEGTKLINNGTLIVDGALIIDGEAANNGTLTINNSATINAEDQLTNEREGVINIFGELANSGKILNRGVINGSVDGNQPEVETYTIDLATVSAGGAGYTLSGDLITLTQQDVIYILTGATSSKRVEVAPNINTRVVFYNMSISSESDAFAIKASSTVRLTLEGTNELTSSNGVALNEAAGVNLTILGTGSLVANGSTAGIGNATTTVNNGWVTASSIAGTLKMEGNAVVIATTVADNSAKTNGVLFVGNEGKLYGAEVAPDFDYTVPAGATLTVDNAKTLTVTEGKTLTNNGEIHVYGDLDVAGDVENNGAIYKYGNIAGEANITGNAVQTGIRNSYPIDLATVITSGTGYTYSGGTITLTENNAEYVLTGETTTKRIVVPASVSLNVKLQNASISVNRPFYITPLAVVNLELEGANTLKSTGQLMAALSVPQGAKVIISGSGSLDAQATKYNGSGHCGAGIGGDSEKIAGNIIINDGTINATSWAKAAGIGGGYHAGYDEITINGGFVNANVKLYAGTQGDGIGGYGNVDQVALGKFTIKNAVVFSSYTRDKKQHENSLVFDDRRGVIYGTNAVIDRDITLPQYGIMTVKKDQTLTVNEGATLTIPSNSLLRIEEGAALVVNGNIVGLAQSTFENQGGTVVNEANVNIATIPYDYRDRLYLDFHIIKNITGVENPGALSDAGVTTTTNTIHAWERFMEGLYPNINVVINIDTLETSGVIQGKRNHAIQVNIGNYSIPGAAGVYYGNTIEVPSGAGGWSSVGVVVHEYYHHTTQYVTASDPDDGRSFDQLYQDWSDLRSNQFVQFINNAEDIGEAWDGDNVWLRNDPKTQTRPENVVFPKYVTINRNAALSTAKWTGASGDGTFAMANPGYKPSTQGEYYNIVFTPSDLTTSHVLTQLVQVRFTGEKLPLTINVSQPNITTDETPSPVYSVDPAEQYIYNACVVEYKVQNSDDPFTTVVPTAPGAYTVRVSFAGDDDYAAATGLANFTISVPQAINFLSEAGDPIRVAAGEGFIKIVKDGGKSQSVRVYTLTGSLYAATNTASNETTIHARQGLYIVNCGTARKKVFVK
jgi:hypothetical protein